MRTPDCQARRALGSSACVLLPCLPRLRRALRGVCSDMLRALLRCADAIACAMRRGYPPASQVASLGAANTGAAAEAGRPYAELWLGTHPSGPAVLPGACSSCGGARSRNAADRALCSAVCSRGRRHAQGLAGGGAGAAPWRCRGSALRRRPAVSAQGAWQRGTSAFVMRFRCASPSRAGRRRCCPSPPRCRSRRTPTRRWRRSCSRSDPTFTRRG